MGRRRALLPKPFVNGHSMRVRYTTDAGSQCVTLGPVAQPDVWKAAYARLTAKLAKSPNAVLHPKGEYLCAELAARYLSELHCTPVRKQVVKRALMLWAGPDGPWKMHPAKEFGPVELEAYQSHLAGLDDPKHKRPYTTTTVNEFVGIVRQAIRFGVRKAILPPSAVHALEAVPAATTSTHERLRPPGEPTAVPLDNYRAVRPYLPTPVRALLDLQLLTGSRPGVLMRLRPCDLHRGGVVELPRIGLVDLDKLPGKPWAYAPQQHKTARYGKSSVILFGPEAQAVLAPLLDRRPADLPLFSPAEAMRERLDKSKDERRKWNEACRAVELDMGFQGARRAGFIKRYGSYKRPAAQPKSRPRSMYDRTSYRNAVLRACRSAGVPEFTPYRLRHTALQYAELAAGLDVAQALAGHSSPQTTRRYTKQNIRLAALGAAGVADLIRLGNDEYERGMEVRGNVECGRDDSGNTGSAA